jgi:hypothetical protein
MDQSMHPGDICEDLKYSLMMLGETRKWAGKFREKVASLVGKTPPQDVMCRSHIQL